VRIEDDPRLAEGIALFHAEEFAEAGDRFEELFFEGVRDEVPFARVLLQLAVGCLHAERRQERAAAGRLDEALRALRDVTDDRGFDLAALRAAIVALIPSLGTAARAPWPRILPRE
jgi:predicted metal-dependent hydrolase